MAKPTTKEIDAVMKKVKAAYDTFPEPIVTEIGKITKSPYQVLISCILSLRTKDDVTADASRRLFKVAKTPKQMLTLTEKHVEKLIYPVGFYRVKAQNVLKVSKIILEEYNNKVPKTVEELTKLPGVGRKTANITVVYGHNLPGMPIDIHCHRIPNRLGWIHTKNPDETEAVMRKLLPKKYWIDFNTLFVAYGQNICLPVSPWCSKCPVQKHCKRIGVKKSR